MESRYSRFYVRTALYIGAALTAFVVIGAGSFGAIAAWELSGYVDTRQSTLSEEAAVILSERGEDGLVDWMNNAAEIPDNVSIYILDQQGRDLLGKRIPEEYDRFIRSSVIGSDDAGISNFEPVRLAPTITSPAGTSYSFLIIPKGISLWGSKATLLGLTTVALLVIACVAWLIARTITRPVGQLQLAVRELASGDIEARVPLQLAGRKDELGALADDFNRMAARLQQLIEGRESLFQEMSHELRSPLARLQAAIELAEEQTDGKPDQHRLRTEICRMNQVIGDMLEYSSLDAPITVRQQLVRINRKLADIIEANAIEADKAGCLLTLDTESDLTVIGDPELLERGLENIIRNAIRFAPHGSEIEVTARRCLNESLPGIAVTIADRGPGVAPEHLEAIFEPYFKIKHDNGGPSSGLGLAIVQRVFRQHGGSAKAENRPGGGLLVSIFLPAARLS